MIGFNILKMKNPTPLPDSQNEFIRKMQNESLELCVLEALNSTNDQEPRKEDKTA